MPKPPIGGGSLLRASILDGVFGISMIEAGVYDRSDSGERVGARAMVEDPSSALAVRASSASAGPPGLSTGFSFSTVGVGFARFFRGMPRSC